MTKIIKINNQKEWDNLPASFDEYTEIEIYGELDLMDRYIDNSYIKLFGNIKVMRGTSQVGEMRGTSQVDVMWETSQVGVMYETSQVGEMYETSQVGVMYETSQVGEMWGTSRVGVMYETSQVGEMYETSQVGVMYETSQVGVMYETSQVGEMWGTSRVGVMYETSQVGEMWGTSQVGVMYETSQVGVMYETSQVGEMWGTSRVGVMRGTSRVGEMWETSQVGEMWETSQVGVKSVNISIKLNHFAVAICIGMKWKDIKNKKKSKTAIIVEQPEFIRTRKSVLGMLSRQDGKIVLYKTTSDKFEPLSYNKNGIVYKPGTIVKCPDFNPDESIQYGQGLHLSPTISEALGYNNSDTILKCLVAPKDIAVYVDDISKFRCKQVEVLCQVDRFGNEIKGDKNV